MFITSEARRSISNSTHFFESPAPAMNAQNQTFEAPMLELPAAGNSILRDQEITPFLDNGKIPQSNLFAIQAEDHQNIGTLEEASQSPALSMKLSQDEEIRAGLTSYTVPSKGSISSEKPLGSKAFLKSWVLELTFLVLGLLCFTAIVTILLSMRGQKQPRWPYTLNLSTLVAILATTLRSLLMEVVEQGTKSLTIRLTNWSDYHRISALTAH